MYVAVASVASKDFIMIYDNMMIDQVKEICMNSFKDLHNF